MTTRRLDPKAFAQVLRVTVPKTIQSRQKKAFLILATDVHRELTIGTPVDTGFARASIAAATVGVPFPAPPVRPTGHTLKARQFAPLWPRSQMLALSAIAKAVKNLTRLTFAYGANYAIYETSGIPANVRRVKALLPSLMSNALRRVQQTTPNEAAD